MKKILFVILLLVNFAAFAQKDTAALLDAVKQFEKALIARDTSQLNALMHKDLLYGHSSGWVQTKKEVVNDLVSGFIIYNQIEDSSIQISLSKEKAIVQEMMMASGARDGKTFQVRLFVMEVWLHHKKGWQLFSRQGTKL